jgi:GR25 family glycosyltransferase involved in LPS biosynthesis
MSVPVKVISLRRSTDRRAAMTTHLAEHGLTPQFFDAVDGYTMSLAEIAEMRPGANPRYGTPLKPGEIGLAASFRNLCREIASGSDPFVGILEDDAVLDPRAITLLDFGYLASLPRFDILRIGHGGMLRPRLFVVHGEGDGFRVIAPVLPVGLTHAQIFSRAGAARIAEGLVPLHAAIDTHMFNDGHIRGLRILQTEPALAAQREWPSTIDAEAAWPHAGVVARIKAKWARTAAVARNINNYVQAWGLTPLMLALVRNRPASTRR